MFKDEGHDFSFLTLTTGSDCCENRDMGIIANCSWVKKLDWLIKKPAELFLIATSQNERTISDN